MYKVNMTYEFKQSEALGEPLPNSWDVEEVDEDGKRNYVTYIQYWPNKDKFISAYGISLMAFKLITKYIRSNNLMEKA